MPETRSLPDYASLIISFRRPDLVGDVLRALREQTHPPRRVIVVDNAGDLDTTGLVSRGFPGGLTIVRRADNPGYGAAVNEARSLLEGSGLEYLQILTHDAQFDPSLGARLMSSLDSAPSVGATAPLLHWVSRPDAVFSAGGRLTRNGRALNTVQPLDPREPYEVDWVDGAIVLYRIAALNDIEWLDERYFLYFEDVDTSWRLIQAGWSVTITPGAVAAQEPGTHPMYLGIRNMTIFGTRHGFAPWRTGAAVLRRVAEEAVVRVMRRRSPELGRAWAGWKDGRRLRSGNPEVGG